MNVPDKIVSIIALRDYQVCALCEGSITVKDPEREGEPRTITFGNPIEKWDWVVVDPFYSTPDIARRGTTAVIRYYPSDERPQPFIIGQVYGEPQLFRVPPVGYYDEWDLIMAENYYRIAPVRFYLAYEVIG